MFQLIYAMSFHKYDQRNDAIVSGITVKQEINEELDFAEPMEFQFLEPKVENCPAVESVQHEESPVNDTPRLSMLESIKRIICQNHVYGQPVPCAVCGNRLKVWTNHQSVQYRVHPQLVVNHAAIHQTSQLYRCRYCYHGDLTRFRVLQHLRSAHKFAAPTCADYHDLTEQHRQEVLDAVERCFGNGAETTNVEATKSTGAKISTSERASESFRSASTFKAKVIKQESNETPHHEKSSTTAPNSNPARTVLLQQSSSQWTANLDPSAETTSASTPMNFFPLDHCEYALKLIDIRGQEIWCNFGCDFTLPWIERQARTRVRDRAHRALRHALTHVPVPLFRCDCGFETQTNESLDDHVKSDHMNGVPPNFDDLSVVHRDEILKAFHLCFNRKSKAPGSMLPYPGPTSNSTPLSNGQNESSNFADLVQHVRQFDDRGSFECGLCSNRHQFLTASSAVEHGMVHFGKPIYECQHCESSTSTIRNMRFHLRYDHQAIKTSDADCVDHIGEFKDDLLSILSKCFGKKNLPSGSNGNSTKDQIQSNDASLMKVASGRKIKRVATVKFRTMPDGVYKCPGCNASFRYKTLMIRHQKLIHKLV